MSQTGGINLQNLASRQSAAIIYNQQPDQPFPIAGIIASASNTHLGLGNKKVSELTRI